MTFKNIAFVTSVADSNKLVDGNLPEIAVAGKSNVGKSSFINMLASRKKLARVSSAPGRTRLLNYFDFDGKFMLVDLPGYGFAKVAKFEKEKWGKLVEGYLQYGRNLKRVLLLLDSRHEPTQDDLLMINYLHHYAIPFTIVLTKADKLSRNELFKSKRAILASIKLTENDIIVSSAEKGQGRDEVFALIENVLANSDSDDIDMSEE